ncbi:MAG: glutamine-hydrolyzing carbamoyl-phosphate synthase small subunit [Candidatus Omnitrophica bacterium]|nr:glutamine-hydrolyzing carbamoyl-phosphate synthase small subunit [Candidatus Omnitrophota bacterium]
MEMADRAKLILEDGRIFEGLSFGVRGEAFGEVVFNTSISGYQEILTDPSYKGQIVTMTYPLIGNYGVNPDDVESAKIFLEGFVVKEYSEIASNWRSKMTLSEYLIKNNIVAIEDIDTRALTKHIREKGAMKAVISVADLDNTSLLKKLQKAPDLVGRDLVKEVTSKAPYEWSKKGAYKVAVIDCGVKYNILRHLEKRDCALTVFPADTKAETIMKIQPNGIFLSNGPGDPEALPYVYNLIKNFLGKIPIFGICLGHQMLGLALGGRTYKLKFGHHGGNQPVMDLNTGTVSITAQNHGFCVDMDSLKGKKVRLTHINLNDRTPEGMESDELNFFSVQFHPEAGPGPNDPNYLFDKFIDRMKYAKTN